MRNLFKIGLVGVLGFLLGAAPAYAQSRVVPAYSTGTDTQVIDVAHPMPVGQAFTDISVSPTVTANSAYTTGNAVGALQTITLPTTSGRIEEVTLYSKSAQTAEVDLIWCGGAQPTSTTITDKTAGSLNTADFSKCRQIVQLTNWRAVGTPSAADSGQVSIPYNLGGASTTGYLFLVTQGAPTFASTSDLTLTLRVAR